MPAMRHRALGDSQVGAIGLGDVSPARAEARGIYGLDRIVHDAIEKGVDLVDAAEDGEAMVGAAIRDLRARDHVTYATRIPLLADRIYPDGRSNLLSDRLPTAYLQARVEHSLKATRLEPIPLVLLPLTPKWLESSAWPEFVGACARLQQLGTVMRWGAIVAPTAPVIEPWLTAIATRFSACRRDALPAIAAAFEAKLSVLAYEPLAGGALAGTLGPGRHFAPNDDRKALTPAELESIAVGVAKLSRLCKTTPPAATSSAGAKEALETTKRPDEIHCTSVAELALRYVIDKGLIAMPRIHDYQQIVDARLAAAAAPLPADLVERIEATI